MLSRKEAHLLMYQMQRQELRPHSPTYFEPPVPPPWDHGQHMSYWFSSYPMLTLMPWLTPRPQSDWDRGSYRSRSPQRKSKPSASLSKPPEELHRSPSPLRPTPASPSQTTLISDTPTGMADIPL
ncbi:UNVERIFIED_CONTAM: hypothetical protein K2H54_075138 [Gekko kuhli]